MQRSTLTLTRLKGEKGVTVGESSDVEEEEEVFDVDGSTCEATAVECTAVLEVDSETGIDVSAATEITTSEITTSSQIVTSEVTVHETSTESDVIAEVAGDVASLAISEGTAEVSTPVVAGEIASLEMSEGTAEVSTPMVEAAEVAAAMEVTDSSAEMSVDLSIASAETTTITTEITTQISTEVSQTTLESSTTSEITSVVVETSAVAMNDVEGATIEAETPSPSAGESVFDDDLFADMKMLKVDLAAVNLMNTEVTSETTTTTLKADVIEMNVVTVERTTTETMAASECVVDDSSELISEKIEGEAEQTETVSITVDVTLVSPEADAVTEVASEPPAEVIITTPITNTATKNTSKNKLVKIPSKKVPRKKKKRAPYFFCSCATGVKD